ncbi:MAG TPA: serine/threonine-protein kinase [Steroidobacteraceae bacterium]|nr:serine/threonine-protein kinase [Steroidobacteraceae bacterium]
MNAALRPMPQKLGKYEVRREVGRGGMGVVYEGFDPVIDRRVALKTFIHEFFDGTQSDNLLTRLRREAQAAGRLSHPNIIAVYDFGEDKTQDADGSEHTTAFIAMEFVEGRSLESYFEAHERFPMAEIMRIMRELLDALGYSHEHGVVHRDIKPANIILLKDGTVKVADFGVARIESSTLTQVGTVLGSPSYMSPEQFMGQTVDGRSDLYSAGVVLYELLTGEVAFTGAYTTIMHRVLNETPSPPSALNVQVPKAFDGLLSMAMAKRPDERFQSAAAFKQALSSIGSTSASASPGAITDSPSGTMIRPAATLPPTAPPGQPPFAPSAAPPFAPSAASPFAPSAASPTAARSGPPPSRSGGLSPRALFAILGVLLLALAAAGAYWWTRPSRTDDIAAKTAAVPPTPAPQGTLISAVGVANPADPAIAKDPGAAERALVEDARQQAVAKAVALYVEPASLDANYGVIRAKLLSRSGDFITAVVQQPAPQVAADGRLVGTLRADVNVREIEKALNEISREDRVEFIRNNGDPRIAVAINVQDWNAPGPTGPSDVAANLLKERIRSFGFTVVDPAANPPPDFKVNGEVHFKRLAAKLPASGVTVEKFVLTAWTINAIDTKSGQEIYHNTEVPQKQSWATEELALQEVGRLIGAEFNKNFFLQYFDFKPKTVRLRFQGVPGAGASALLTAVNSSLVVVNATAAAASGGDLIIDADLSGGAAPAAASVQRGILEPLNRKMGQSCFNLAGPDAPELSIAFDPSCSAPAVLNRLGAPAQAPATPPAAPSPQGPAQPSATTGKVRT